MTPMLALAACSGPPALMQVAVPGAIFGSPAEGAPVVEQAPLGLAVTARKGPFWRPDDWRSVRTETGEEGWLPASVLLPLPVHGETRYVSAEDAAVLRPSGEKGPPLTVGSPVEVLELPAGSDTWGVVQDGRLMGQLPKAAVGDAPPTVDGWLALIEARVEHRDLAHAGPLAEAAVSAHPDEAGLTALRDALAAARAPLEAVPSGGLPALSTRLDPSPSQAYVETFDLVLRAEPSETADAVLTLPYGQPVRVDDTEGSWSEVAVSAPGLVDLRAAGAPFLREPLDGEGYVPTRALNARQRFPADLAGLAAQLLKKGKKEAALEALYRRALLVGDRDPDWPRFVQLLFELRAFPLLSATLRDASPLGPVADLGGILARVVDGCRTDVLRVEVDGHEDPLEQDFVEHPEDACVWGLDTREPCPVVDFGAEDVQSPDEDRAASETADRARSRHDRVTAAFEKHRDRMRELFPVGPFADVSLGGRPETDPPRRTLFAYTVPLELVEVGECDSEVHVAAAKAELVPIDVPAAWKDAALEIWWPLEDANGVEVGVLDAADEQAARAWLEARAATPVPTTYGGVRGIWLGEVKAPDLPEDLAGRVRVLAFADTAPDTCGSCDVPPGTWLAE